MMTIEFTKDVEHSPFKKGDVHSNFSTPTSLEFIAMGVAKEVKAKRTAKKK